LILAQTSTSSYRRWSSVIDESRDIKTNNSSHPLPAHAISLHYAATGNIMITA
jgi:hypothetical protein